MANSVVADDLADQKPTETTRRIMRRDDRILVRIRAICHVHGSHHTVQVVNISVGGAALAQCNSMMENDLIVLELMNKRRIEARVRWWLKGSCGIQFVTRLNSNDMLLMGKVFSKG